MQPSYNTSYLRTSYFCANCQYHFLANIPLYIGKISWKNYVRFWKWNLKRTPQLVKKSFLRESYSKFCFIFNMISFANAQGLVKIRLACSKALLLTISSSNIVTHSKGDKYLFLFTKQRYNTEI